VRVKNPWQDDSDDDFRSLSVEEAQQWRSQQTAIPVWQLIAWQLVAGLVAALVLGLVWQSTTMALSAAYGALAVVLPNAALMRGMAGLQGRLRPEAVVLRFFVWELVKIGLSIAMLGGARQVLGELSWPALLTGLVVTMKVNWFLLAFRPRKHGLPDGKD
jgi:ATP synthase protein I